jgi:hypothetical protein
MSKPNARHAAPSRPVGRRLAGAAAALAAGAVPLAVAGAAAAATVPAESTPPVGSTFSNSAFPESAFSDTALSSPTPSHSALSGSALSGSVLPDAGAHHPAAQNQVRLAPQTRSAVHHASGPAVTSNRGLADGAEHTAERLTAALPLSGLLPRAGTTSPIGPLQLAPNVLRNATLGLPAAALAPRAGELADGLAGQAKPLVAQLRRNGVPTVGDLTGKLSQTRLPVIGAVGGITGSLPVTTVLGSGSPVTGALQNLDGL